MVYHVEGSFKVQQNQESAANIASLKTLNGARLEHLKNIVLFLETGLKPPYQITK